MSDEEEKDKELDDEMQQLMEREAEEKAAARGSKEDENSSDTGSQPEPTPEAKPDAQVQDEDKEPEAESEPVTPKAAAPKPAADDPMEWAKKKGLSSPEAIARSLQNMEQEFHKRNQNGHPGYQDLSNGNPQPQMPPVQNGYQPRPDMGYQPQYPNYGYPPPPSRTDVSQQLSKKYGMDPEDVERLMPMIVDAAEAIASRRTSVLERDFINFRKSAMRNQELMDLMQDPAFTDPRVQQEMHEVLKDGRLFQQGNAPYATAFQVAMQNLARKQLQQGAITASSPSNRPPTTAGGGNGSAITSNQITEKVFNSWTEKEQRAYLESNGKRIPRR